MKSQKGVSLISIIIVVVVLLVLIFFFKNFTNENNNITQGTSKFTYTLGDTITFDGLELTFDSNYSFDVVASTIVTDYNGDYIKLGVTIKNVSTEKNSLSAFDYSFYGSKGTQLKGIAGYFDDDVNSMGDLKPSASYKTYFYIPYDGNGNYSIDFGNPSKISVEFEILK